MQEIDISYVDLIMDLYHLLFFAAFLMILANPVPETSLAPLLSDPEEWNFGQTNPVKQNGIGSLQDPAPVAIGLDQSGDDAVDDPFSFLHKPKTDGNPPTFWWPGFQLTPQKIKICNPLLPVKACCAGSGLGYYAEALGSIWVFDVPTCINSTLPLEGCPKSSLNPTKMDIQI